MGYGVAETWAARRRGSSHRRSTDDLIAEYDRDALPPPRRAHEPLPGVASLSRRCRQRRRPIGLASSSWPGWIEALLGGIGLRGAFDAVVSATMVAHGKPAPDIYLLAAERTWRRAGALHRHRGHAARVSPRRKPPACCDPGALCQHRVPAPAEADIVLDSLRDFDVPPSRRGRKRRD